MRLIDADTLFRKMEEAEWYNNADRDEIAETLVLNAPTIEERKKGKWIRITQGAMPEKYMCPFCHRTVEHEGTEYFVSMMYPFCHCGADMGGKTK